MAQHGRNFFLNVNDQLGLAQLPAQSLDLTPQVFEFLVPGVACAFVAAFIVLEALEGTGLVLPSPLGQGRGIEAFSAQQGANLAGAGASLCLFDDAGLVSRCEPTSVQPGRYLRIGGGGPTAATYSPASSVHVAIVNGRRLSDGEALNLNEDGYDLVLDTTRSTLKYRKTPRAAEPAGAV